MVADGVLEQLREKGAHIQSADDFLDFLLLMERKGVESEREAWACLDLTASKIIVEVHTEGARWDRRIDWRGARLIQEIQQNADKVVSRISDQRVLMAAPIKVEAKDGSNGLEFDLTQVVMSAMASLSPDQVFMLCKYVVAGCFGLWGFKAWSAHRLAMEQKKTDRQAAAHAEAREKQYLEHEEKLVRELAENFGSANFIKAPMQRYAAALAEGDCLTVGKNDAVTPKQARKILAFKRQRLTQTFVNCDGQYYLTGLKMKQEPPSVVLEQNDTKVDASLMALAGPLRSMLLEEMKQAMEIKKLPLRMDIQAEALCNKNKILGVKLVGLGPVRNVAENYELAELPAAVADMLSDE